MIKIRLKKGLTLLSKSLAVNKWSKKIAAGTCNADDDYTDYAYT